MESSHRGLYETMSSGVDWLTASAAKGSASLAFERYAESFFADEKAAGRAKTSGCRLGYVGYSVDGFFHGRRSDGNVIVLSGPRADPLAQEVIQLSTNVSRVDLQTTVWANGEQPELARQSYATLKRVRPKNGRPSWLRFQESNSGGSTLDINKRVSDTCGRIYDKASESGVGPARSIWRYEVEFKRKQARRVVSRLLRDTANSTTANDEVYRWMTDKGIQWPAAPGNDRQFDDQLIVHRNEDELEWIRKNLSKHIARRIRSHGLPVILEALGLDHLVEPVQTRK